MNKLQVHVKEMKTFNLMGVLPRLVVRIYIHTKRYAHESTIRMIRKRETDRGKEEEKKLIIGRERERKSERKRERDKGRES